LSELQFIDGEGLTLLHHAARVGHLKIVEYLVACGADINKQDHSGFTPLYEASLHGYQSIMSFLLSKGADVNLQDAHGRTVLHILCEKGNQDGAVLCLIEGKNVDLNKVDMFDRAALHWACKTGLEDFARILLGMGADVHLKTKGGDTALHWASYNGYGGICKLLLEKGASPTAVNNKNELPNQIAKTNQIEKLLSEALESKIVEESFASARVKDAETKQDDETVAPIKVLSQKPPVKKLKITLKK